MKEKKKMSDWWWILIGLIALVIMIFPVSASKSENSQVVFMTALLEYTEDYAEILDNITIDINQSYIYLGDLRELSNKINEEELPIVYAPYYDVIQYSFARAVDFQVTAIENDNDYDLSAESILYLKISLLVSTEIFNLPVVDEQTVEDRLLNSVSGVAGQAERIFLNEGAVFFEASISGGRSSNFIVRLKDSNGNIVDLIVNEIPPSQGGSYTAIVSVPYTGYYFLDVIADTDSSWTISWS